VLHISPRSPSGSLPSFAAQSTNGRNAKNRPFAALVANVSVADEGVIRFLRSKVCFIRFAPAAKNTQTDKPAFATRAIKDVPKAKRTSMVGYAAT
jgi:hypothetical protein